MIADSERREVARKLREINPYRNQSYTVPYHRYTPAAEYLAELAGALGYSPKNDVSRLEFQSKLADLIEPEPERTCRKVTGRMKYGRRMPKCSECGQSLGDERWAYCPNCGAMVVEE